MASEIINLTFETKRPSWMPIYLGWLRLLLLLGVEVDADKAAARLINGYKYRINGGDWKRLFDRV